jgi:hypothetical protein
METLDFVTRQGAIASTLSLTNPNYLVLSAETRDLFAMDRGSQ